MQYRKIHKKITETYLHYTVNVQHLLSTWIISCIHLFKGVLEVIQGYTNAATALTKAPI